MTTVFFCGGLVTTLLVVTFLGWIFGLTAFCTLGAAVTALTFDKPTNNKKNKAIIVNNFLFSFVFSYVS